MSGASKSTSLIAVVNKVLLAHDHTRLFTDCLWLLRNYEDRLEELWQRPQGPQIKDIYLLALYRERSTPL